MSKDLEKEYRALVKSEAPDLWARIEAGLDEKEVFHKSGEENRNNKNNINKNNINKIKKFFPVKVWAATAAACVCVGLLIPLMRGGLMGGMKESQSQNNSPAPPQMAMDTAGYYSMYDDVVPNSIDAGFPESSSADAGSGLKSSTNNAVTTKQEDAAFDADNAMDGAAGDAAEQEAAVETDAFQAEVEILNAAENMDGSTVYTVYTAKVQSSENPDLKTGGEISIISADNAVLLEVGKTYKLALCGDGAGEEPVYGIAELLYE